MEFYLITPKDKYSPSRRWFTDSVGFKYVKNHYTHYPKGVNKWADFNHKQINSMRLDFGGMSLMHEVSLKLQVYDTMTFEVPATHLQTLVSVLSNKYYSEKDPTVGLIWSFKVFGDINVVISEEIKDAMLTESLLLQEHNKEIIDDSYKEFNDRIKSLNCDNIIAKEKNKQNE